MADAMDMAPKSRKVVTMLLSEDQPITDVPVSDYDFHSGGIIETLEGLLNTFRERKTTLESDNETAESDFNMAMQAKLDQLKQAQESLENKQKEKTETSEDIATSQADLTETNAMLNDDRVYLKDLTEKCESKAKLWDQRSQMRADELSALTQALSVLESAVAEKAEATGEGGRSLSQKEETKTEDKKVEPVAFVQEKVVRKMVPESDDDAQKRDRIVSLLTSAGKKLQSTVLSTLALKVAKDDPFKKIKGMIQELIERLLQEEADEGNHKGWCDTEISKTLKDRDYRLRDITDLHSSIEKLNARKEKLNLTKTELTEEIATLEDDLANQTAERAEEKAEHEQTIADSGEGLEAIKEAIDILDHFYKTAAKALVQQPSVDDEAPDAGFDDTYKASQGAATGILGMMEVIMGDFERTIKETTAAEEQAKRDFVEYDRETRMSIAAKTNALEATSAELEEVMDNLATAGDELRTQQELLDTAVKTWEELLPGCVADPGMSYEERVARREQELQALKDAYCILDDQEAGCSGVFLQKSAVTKRFLGA
jgi:flagellar hook-basal body complex protein FliE